jgi:hypothetical protein
LQQASAQLQQFQQGLTSRLNPALTQTSQALTQVGTQAGQMGTQMASATRATSALSQALQVASGIGIATSVGAMTSAVVAFGRETIATGARLDPHRASRTGIGRRTP